LDHGRSLSILRGLDLAISDTGTSDSDRGTVRESLLFVPIAKLKTVQFEKQRSKVNRDDSSREDQEQDRYFAQEQK